MHNHRCGKMTVRSQRNEHGQITYLAAGCKAWRCNYCGPKKAEKLKRAIARAAEEKGLTRFLTLTLDTKFLTDADLNDSGIAYIRKTWGKLRIYFKREYGKSIDFISILELQKRGVVAVNSDPQEYAGERQSKRSSPIAGVPLKRAGEMLGVKAKTLHNRISRGDFREGEDIRKPMGRVLMSLVTVQRLLDGTHPCQRRRRLLNG